MFRRYMYLSHAIPGFGPDDLDQLVTQSASRNERYGVSGLLIFSNGHFMQFVEGPESAIGQLRIKIDADPRHDSVTELRYSMAPRRLFEGWALACNLPARHENLALQVTRNLTPQAWDGEDIEVLSMLGRFWSEFGVHLDLVDSQAPHWRPAVLED